MSDQRNNPVIISPPASKTALARQKRALLADHMFLELIVLIMLNVFENICKCLGMSWVAVAVVTALTKNCPAYF
jgi:hypothetical protein